eukprot:443221-Rhodomonas_salina.5
MACDVMSGTEVAFGATQILSLSHNLLESDCIPGLYLPTPCYAMSSTDVVHGATAMLCPRERMVLGLRACYAMSGTDIAYGATRGYDSWRVLPTSSHTGQSAI